MKHSNCNFIFSWGSQQWSLWYIPWPFQIYNNIMHSGLNSSQLSDTPVYLTSYFIKLCFQHVRLHRGGVTRSILQSTRHRIRKENKSTAAIYHFPHFIIFYTDLIQSNMLLSSGSSLGSPLRSVQQISSPPKTISKHNVIAQQGPFVSKVSLDVKLSAHLFYRDWVK